jgi:hypothetical protein
MLLQNVHNLDIIIYQCKCGKHGGSNVGNKIWCYKLSSLAQTFNPKPTKLQSFRPAVQHTLHA